MKVCKCGETDLSEFWKCKSTKDGYKHKCKACLKLYGVQGNRKKLSSKKYHVVNREKINEKGRIRRSKLTREGKDKINTQKRKYWDENKEKQREQQNKRNAKNSNHVSLLQCQRFSKANSSSKINATNHGQQWTCHDFEIAVRKRESGPYIFTAKETALRLGRTIASINRIRRLYSEGSAPSDFTGKRSEYFSP